MQRESERERDLESLLNSLFACLILSIALDVHKKKTRSPCAGKRLTDAKRGRVGDGSARCRASIGGGGVKVGPWSGFVRFFDHLRFVAESGEVGGG